MQRTLKENYKIDEIKKKIYFLEVDEENNYKKVDIFQKKNIKDKELDINFNFYKKTLQALLNNIIQLLMLLY